MICCKMFFDHDCHFDVIMRSVYFTNWCLKRWWFIGFKRKQFDMIGRCLNWNKILNILEIINTIINTPSRCVFGLCQPTFFVSNSHYGCIVFGHVAIHAQELEVRSLNHPYSLKTKSSQCHYVVMTRSETKFQAPLNRLYQKALAKTEHLTIKTMSTGHARHG